VVDPEILEARTLHVLHHVGRLRAQSATTAEAFAGVGDLEQFLRALGPSATAG
jgi:hypothetical protein